MKNHIIIFMAYKADMTDKSLYGKYILENYSKEDIDELEKEIKPERDFLIYL